MAGERKDLTLAMRDEYVVRRGIMLTALADIPGLRPFVPRGTFFVWAELDAKLSGCNPVLLQLRDCDGTRRQRSTA